MGIVNCTPDSFSDGGRLATWQAALERALEMVRDGADVIDIGGESTRPGATPVGEAEELRRVLPVIERLREASDVLISCDTTKAEVARRALLAGADLINDISAIRYEPAIAEIAAEAGAGVILMHTRGTPQTMTAQTSYADVVEEVCAHLRARVEAVVARGVLRERIVLDPGVGFAKGLEDNLRLIRHAARFRLDGAPVLIGPSRKRFIGELTGVSDPAARGWGTAGAVAAAALYGADLLRVHDVKAMREVLQVATALRDA
jgi:dihydropteroate synthase